ncbi:MAG: ABC transporter permease [Spirochaetales bacterium]
MSLSVYFVRRLLQMIPVLFGVVFLVFSLMHLVPGDPAQIMAGERADPAQLERVRSRLGLDDPLYVQYGRYLGNAIQGDLGESVRNNRPVTQEIFSARYWITLQLAVMSIALAIFIGLIAGVVSAIWRYSLFDTVIMLIALFGLSMPNFWLGIMLIYWFSVQLSILPAAGWGTLNQAILPVITLGTAGAAVIARMTRSSMLEVINQDYIRTARAKGVRESVVINKHALRNAMIPVVTVVGLQFGFFLGGSVLTETVFAINGLGRLMVSAIYARDFPVVQGAVLVASVSFMFVNLFVDMTYKLLNKRIELN